ncbi:hypothetical protein CCHR01_07442 [Colletotrichum chrysophilum]|uniref:Uncharacterized protein n=1 Tax=Colletotrichum chrysophilum TaxID=1836956 RepID=A0AAD9EFY1_9PEZI|nr:hypothetical protein CCHR01_07442 [Colletotrichum chrysophilum]
MGERTGSRVLRWVWSYVVVCEARDVYEGWLSTVSANRSESSLRRTVRLRSTTKGDLRSYH